MFFNFYGNLSGTFVRETSIKACSQNMNIFSKRIEVDKQNHIFIRNVCNEEIIHKKY